MDKEDLPSDSDESDEDYAPNLEEDSNPPSEVESDGDAEEDPAVSGDEREVKAGKRKRKQKIVKKKSKGSHKKTVEDVVENAEDESEEKKALTEQEEKQKTDSLWSDFMSCTSTSKPKPAAPINETTLKKKETVKPEPIKIVEKKKKVTITKIFEFAGEEVRVTKEVSSDSAEARLTLDKNQPTPTASRGRAPAGLKGLSAVLGQLGKKEKIGTLEKSKLDWDRFKRAEGIEDEVQTFNRGKDGYLEKQDFLQRADLRQFEIEKDIRTTRRSNR